MLLVRRRRAVRRAGFTLVEVLVAAGLCLLIMTVLAVCFQAGMDTLSQLKSLGDMQQQLRTADVLLRRDLTAQHLESPYGNRVSDQRMDLWDPNQPTGVPAWNPPPVGFFRIYQGIPNPAIPVGVGTGVTVTEGFDPDNLPSTRATTHILHMTVKVPADRTDRSATAPIPPAAWPALAPLAAARQVAATTATNRFAGEWIEVVYFLDNPTPTTTPSTPGTIRTGQANGMPVYTLYRRARVLTNPRPATMPLHFNGGTVRGATGLFQGMSVSPVATTTIDPLAPANPPAAGLPLNDPSDITTPYNRLGGISAANNTTASQLVHPYFTTIGPLPSQFDVLGAERAGTAVSLSPTYADAVLNNVVSFEIRAAWDVNTNVDFRYNSLAATGQPRQNPNYSPIGQPNENLPAGDTFTIPYQVALPGHSGAADGPFDDLPPAFPLVAPQNPNYSGVRPQIGNPLFQRQVTGVNNQPRVFDTWSTRLPTSAARVNWERPIADIPVPPGNALQFQTNPNFPPLLIRVKAIQIKIRVWDPKNRVARQLTLIEPL